MLYELHTQKNWKMQHIYDNLNIKNKETKPNKKKYR